MKNINIIRVLLLAAVWVSCISCSEFLTQENPNEVTTSTFWTDLNDTESGLNAVYAQYRNQYIYNMSKEAIRSDMAWPGIGRPTATDLGLLSWYQLTYSNSDNNIKDKWDNSYTLIFYANQVIEALDRLKANGDVEGIEQEEKWLYQMAQARFFRGLMHFYLHSAFNNGNVPLSLSVPETTSGYHLPISDAADVLDSFRADLLYAYTNLPAINKAAKERVTRGAAATVLGTSYLYSEEYDDAMFYFNDVLTNPEYEYELVYDLSLLFTNAGEYNSESILEINYDLNLRPELLEWDDFSFINRLAYECGSGEAFPPAWIVYAYANEKMDPLDPRNYYDDPTTPGNLLKRNVALRCSAMCAVVQDEQTAYYDKESVAAGGIFGNYAYGFGNYKKYTNHDLGIPRNKDGRQSGKNVVITRLAEVYLMMAECHIAKGEVDSALKLINDIRKRWGLQLLGLSNGDIAHTYDEIVYDSESLMNHLMYIEKPLELSIEGHEVRWIDLRRWDVIKERFNELAAQTYYLDNYTYTDAGGKVVTRKAAIRKEPLKQDPLTYTIIDYEYDQSANNYIESEHSYLPIPLREEIDNSNIN